MWTHQVQTYGARPLPAVGMDVDVGHHDTDGTGEGCCAAGISADDLVPGLCRDAVALAGACWAAAQVRSKCEIAAASGAQASGG